MAIDVAIIQKPFYYFQSNANPGSSVASHGTPYSYDTNVPLLIEGGKWIKPGRVTDYAETVDIAPTLSTILNIRPPSASEGKVLTRILTTQ